MTATPSPNPAAIPAHILADTPPVRPNQPQPDDGYNIGFEEGTLHLGDGRHRVFINHRKTCAQTRLGEAHPPHEYRYVYRDPFTAEPVTGSYGCDGLGADAAPFPAEPSAADLEVATTVWRQRQPALIDAYRGASKS